MGGDFVLEAVRKKGAVKALEDITSVAVVVAFVLCLGAFLFRTYHIHQQQAPRIGENLPLLAGYDWTSHPHSLVLVLQKGCQFCDNSMPFYRKLYELERHGVLAATMVAVFRDDERTVTNVLRTQSLPIPAISGVDFGTVKAPGTPTLILVDQRRRIEKAWVGELDSAGREGVLNALRVQARTSWGGKCEPRSTAVHEDLGACSEAEKK